MKNTFSFNTPEGYKLIRNILGNRLPFDTHDYQLEAISQILDGRDVLCVTPTVRLAHLAFVVAVLLIFPFV